MIRDVAGRSVRCAMKKLVLLLLIALLSVCALAEQESAMPAGYVRVSTATQAGWLPLPVDGDTTFPLVQFKLDGTQSLNLIHLTPNGVYMEDANCEGHDCVNQGEVTLENREERILWNMVICLPHQLSAELITREEAEQMLGQ